MMEPPEEIEIAVTVEADLTEGWGGERWDVKDVIDERDQSSLGDIGIHEFDAYSDFPERLRDAVLSVLQEAAAFAPEKFYSLRVSVRNGGTEIGWASAHFLGQDVRTRDRE